MTDVQSHRGHDDWGEWQRTAACGDSIYLGARRLSILDLSERGHMPMCSADRRFTIVYNGEIYNHLELRKELAAKGYQFRSTCDTETVLNLYAEMGSGCVTRLNGMFSFAIWDDHRQQLFLARDHFGVKPFYYAQQAGRFAFASEAKALLELPGLECSINYNALDQYLTFLWVPEPHTMFAGIDKLPAGHYGVWKDGTLKLTQYWNWDLPRVDHVFPLDEREITVELRERFLAVVRSQMLSDVPVGVFLSAGLDSSSILAAMRAATEMPLRTFTVTFPRQYRRGETTLDDPEVARRTAQHFGCDHVEIQCTTDAAGLLPKLVWHMDEPVSDPAIIAAYLVCDKARESVKVLLSGVGGDELFAGYRKHTAHYLAAKYQRIPKLLRRELLEPLIHSLPHLDGTSLAGLVRLTKKMARSGSLPKADRFLTDGSYLSEEQRSRLYSDAARSSVGGLRSWDTHLEHLSSVGEADWLNQMLYLDVKTFMVSLNLNYNDKMSMASGVETRVPFLDHELAEWVVANIPPHLKLNHGTTKYILRQAMRPLLPAEIFRQSKAGFGAPISFWLKHEMREMTQDLLSEERIKRRGLFCPAEVHRMLSDHLGGRGNYSMNIWQLLTLELWQQAFIDR